MYRCNIFSDILFGVRNQAIVYANSAFKISLPSLG